MTKRATRMLALMDRATTLWSIPVIGREKGRLIRRLIERHRSRRAVEIGSLLGYSAILIGSEVNSEIEHAAAEAGAPDAKQRGEKSPSGNHQQAA